MKKSLTMTNIETIFELLEECHPKGYCDDCISEQANIRPRQQVNQICRNLVDQNKLRRQISQCNLCYKRKIINTLSVSSDTSSVKNVKKGSVNSDVTITHPNQSVIDIEHTRTDVVRICQELWRRQKSTEPPRSISAIINIMKEERLIPAHQANMMLTICGLRNVHVYENIELGQREKNIATEAWKIISDWWSILMK